MTAAPAASGSVAAGFERVRATFEENAEPGGAFAAMVDGELVVDLWGGVADPAAGRPWGEHTCAMIFSGTKGILATALLVLVERGLLDLDAPVANVWPEFAAAGKAGVTIAQLGSHCSGVPGMETPFDITDPRGMARALAAQAPIVPIGAPSYHAITYGWLAAELIVRADGRTAAEFVRDELALPLGIDLRLGLSPDDAMASERATLRLDPDFRLGIFSAAAPDPRLELVYGVWRMVPEVWNDPAVLALGVPAAGCVGTARGIAELYGRLVTATGPVGTRTLEAGMQPVAAGDDPLTGRLLRFGPTGYELAGTPSALGPASDGFGFTGAGGSSHGGWPSVRTGFSYVTAELRTEETDQRARSLLAALHEAVTAA